MTPQKYNAIHLDLKAHLYRADYLDALLSKISQSGANCLFLEAEDKLPFLPKLGIDVDPVAKGTVQIIKNAAVQRGIQIVPQIQSLAHVEFILQNSKYAFLREKFSNEYQYCPSNPQVRQFVYRFIDLTLKEFNTAEYISLGGDEPWFGGLSMCPVCSKRVDRKGLGEIYIDHYNPIIEHARAQNVRPMIWGDFLVTHRDILKKISKDTIIKHWNYKHTTPGEWLKEIDVFHSQGFHTWVTPSCRCAGDSYFLPNVAKHYHNVDSAVEAFGETKAQGFLNTAWAIRQTPLELSMPLIYAAARRVSSGGKGTLKGSLDEYAKVYWGGIVSGFVDFHLNLCPVWTCFVQKGYPLRNSDGTWDSGLTPEEGFFRFWQERNTLGKIISLAKKITVATLKSKEKLLQLKPTKPSGNYEKMVWMNSLDMQLLKIRTTLLYVNIKTGKKIPSYEQSSLTKEVHRLKKQTRELFKYPFVEKTLQHQLRIRFHEEDHLLNNYCK